MVADIADVVASSQNEAAGFFADVDGLGVAPQLPYLFNGRRPSLGRAPRLGEHTAEVLDVLRSVA